MEDFDIVIVGSGFGGSIASMVSRSLGFRVLLIEKGQHPRFAIGESSTPFANLLLEKIASDFNLPNLVDFSCHGFWQKKYPEIACGLKRGFSFFHHEPGKVFEPSRENQLLVAASPNNFLADTHWYRPDFDATLVRQAAEMGVIYRDKTTISSMVESDSHIELGLERDGVPVRIRARFLVDASGPRGFLWNLLSLDELPAAHLPRTMSVFNHFRNVPSWSNVSGWSEPEAPYPVDDSAVHHLFEGGWCWVLRFNNGITSAGFSIAQDLATELGVGDKNREVLWARLLNRFPTLQKQFGSALPLESWKIHENLYFHSSRATGSRWAMLPSACSFVDPLLSTGFALNLFGILRLGKILQDPESLENLKDTLPQYQMELQADQKTVESLIGALFRNFGNFRLFQKLVMLYFCPVSFGESAWRLEKESRASKFLLQNDAGFMTSFRELCEKSCQSPRGEAEADLTAFLRSALKPYDVAGLLRDSQSHCHPVLMQDLMDNAYKLGASQAEVERFLASLARENSLHESNQN